MKTLLTTTTMLATLASSVSAAPYVLPSQQPGALTRYDIQPVYSLDFLYGIADDRHCPDVYGPRLSFNLYNDLEGDFLHQFNINVAALWGSKDHTATDLLYTYHYDVNTFLLPITLGYDLNINIVENLYFYMGGKAGAAIGRMHGHGDSEAVAGFHWSAGAGLKYYFSDRIYARVGYEYARSYLDLSSFGPSDLGQHTIVVGAGLRF